MKIYTKTGDDGTTGVFGGPRVQKDDLRIEAYGTVDELNAVLGSARNEVEHSDLQQLLATLQDELFAVGAELASPDPVKSKTLGIKDQHVSALERAIDQLEQSLPELKHFVLPGGSRGAAALHMARAVCRRAERRVVTLREHDPLPDSRVLVYLNRLSDLLFVMARFANVASGCAEIH